MTNTPKIGYYWPGQGGIYAGIARGRLDGESDYPLIFSTEIPEDILTWQAAIARAKLVSADGHSDFRVPTRFESALLYANLQDWFDTDHWYWTSTQFSKRDAWDHDFSNGRQDYTRKAYGRRVCFVRKVIIN